MYYLDDTSNKRVYTMAKVDPFGRPTFSAHPGICSECCLFCLFSAIIFVLNLFFFIARFSPDDRYANERIMIKKRFGLLLTQRNADGGGGSSQQNGCTK